MLVACFPNAEIVRRVLSAGLIPPAIASAPVVAWKDTHHKIWVQSHSSCFQENTGSLLKYGVSVQNDSTAHPWCEYTCWAELLPLQKCLVRTQPRPYLIEVPKLQLAMVLAELRRLQKQNEIHRIATLAASNWVITLNPPVYTLLNFAGSQITIFQELKPNVWIQLGWQHPTVDHIKTTAETHILIRPDKPWQVENSVSFQSEPTSFHIPAGSVQFLPLENYTQKLSVQFRLKAAGSQTQPVESYWVFPGDPHQILTNIARELDERVLRQFRFAVLSNSEQRITLIHCEQQFLEQVSAGIPGSTSYVPHAEIPNLLIPAEKQLTPRLSNRSLSESLYIRAEELTWLESTPRDPFIVHRTSQSHFHAADAWVQYSVPSVCQLSVSTRSSWLLSPTLFALDRPTALHDEKHSAIDSLGEVITLTRSPQVRENSESLIERLRSRLFRKKQRSEPQIPDSLSTDLGNIEPVERVKDKLSSPETLIYGKESTTRRSILESQVLSNIPHLESAERAKIWVSLAELYFAIGNHSDASLCWINAIWNEPRCSPQWFSHWLRSEARNARLPGDGTEVHSFLNSPSSSSARLAAAFLAWANVQSQPPESLASFLPRLIRLIDQFESDIPVRAIWLARKAVSDLAHGDALGMARSRDRLCARLTEKGPGLDLDAPSFLRFQGVAGGDRWLIVREWLWKLRESIHRWLVRLTTKGRLQWAGIDPEVSCTSAYADLMCAWGLSKLGDRSRSKALEAHAGAILDRTQLSGADSGVQRVIRSIFSRRIRDALDGIPDRPGLSLEASAELARLDDLARYSVDKLRANSGILEPVDLVNPYRSRELVGFLGSDSLCERLSRLLTRLDLIPESPDIHELLGLLTTDPTASTLPRVVYTLLQLGPRLDPGLLDPVLRAVPLAIDMIPEWQRVGQFGLDSTTTPEKIGCRILLAATHLAGLFQLHDSFRNLCQQVRAAADHPNSPLIRSVELTADKFYRTLRRLGLIDEAQSLLSSFQTAHPPRERELGLAIGHYAAGNEEAGTAILNAARDRLFVTGIPDIRERTRIAIVYASALGHTPPRIALGRLEEIFQRLDRVTITGATNRYYTLYPLVLVDAVIRSVVTDEFSIGPSVRGWLDDDEYNIRQRIHRDLQTELDLRR